MTLWPVVELFVQVTAAFTATVRVDGENALEVDGLKPADAPYSLFYVDSFDVGYPSLYRARGNRAAVSAAGH